MKALTEKILHYLLLATVTIGAIWVMWYLSSKSDRAKQDNSPQVRTLPAVAAQKAAVEVQALPLEMCEITSTYAGKIHPWETYQIAFEVSGRVVKLGENQQGQPLDEGDRVTEGQVLAVLDDRVYRARKSEASARVEQAKSDVQRAQNIRKSNPGAISDSELHGLITDLAMAQAMHEVAIKNVEDATLRAPVNATISLRQLKAGESVNAHQMVFQLVVNDDVLLILDVPESQIRNLESRLRTVRQNRLATDDQAGNQDRTFHARVELEGKDRFGNAWPSLEGQVYRIAQLADQRTGLFEVEVRLSNEHRQLRPGMVATASLVIARISGYRIPESAVIFRGRSTYLFSVSKQATEMEMLYWNVGNTDLFRARQVPLQKWVDQGPHIVVPASEAELSSVIIRGQYRLADKQLVQIVNLDELAPETFSAAKDTERVEIATEP